MFWGSTATVLPEPDTVSEADSYSSSCSLDPEGEEAELIELVDFLAQFDPSQESDISLSDDYPAFSVKL